MINLRRIFAIFVFSLSSAITWAGSVNINTADAQDLAAAIKGVGLKTAQVIVAYREQHGPYHSLDELMKIKGIGRVTLEHNRDHMTVGKVTADGKRLSKN